jgi:hypothetical protein
MRSGDHSYDVDKNGQNHLEMVTTRTPPSEPEKQQLAPVASRGPEVHEKVSVRP